MEELESKVRKDEYSFSSALKLSTQLKSWMAINPSFGCVWDCAYCIQHKDAFFGQSEYRRIHRLTHANGLPITVEDVVSEIMSSPRITSKTPLTFYNYSDPFLPQNCSSLSKILVTLDKRKFTNIVGLITRTYVDEDTLDTIASLQNLRPIMLVTYAGYQNRKLEGAPESMRIKLIKEAKSRNIPVLLYLRPLAKEWLEENQLERVRDFTGNLVDGVIMSGIRLTPEIMSRIESRGLCIPKVVNYKNKFFPIDIQEEIIEIYKGITPVYRYTSCGVSASLKLPDYNAHMGFFTDTQETEYKQCPLPCRKGQSGICAKKRGIKESEVKELLERINKGHINFSIKTNNRILLENDLPKEDLTFLRHNLSAHIDYKGNKHHVDQVANMEVK